MMKLNASARFKRDLKLCSNRHYKMELLEEAVNTLRIPAPLPEKNRDHNLTGNHANERECHLAPDWLLIYRVNDDELYLVRTGTHSDLFGM
jgi:mRNA interferase YafQ